jgi:catechol 2,3-dioxygenase-like lactoylglutathione lyase family enzyme
MVMQFNHIGINVKDIRATLRFYEEHFGAVFVRGLYIPAAHMAGAYIQIGDNMLELLSPLEPDGKTQYGINHFGFIVDDIEAETCDLIARGCHFEVMPKRAGSGAGKIAFLSDPAGARIELIERAETFIQDWQPTEDILGFDHASVQADDLSRSLDFYTNNFGFNIVHNIHVGGGRNFSMVYMNKGRNILEILHKDSNTHDGPLMGHIALRVKNTQKIFDKLTSHGVKINSAPRALATNNGSVCNLQDPDGIGVELIDRVSLFEMKGISKNSISF